MTFEKQMEDNRNNAHTLSWTRQTVEDACDRSNLTVKDMDCFETYDCFTSSEYAAISVFGLTEHGKEYEAIESGLISFDWDKPFKPSGGLIGCGHPAGAGGARMFLNLYKQVSGKAGKYHVKNEKTR